MARFRILGLLSLALAAGCSRDKPASIDDLNSAVVTLPSGKQIKAERMVLTTDLARGMMFRQSLAPDRGMLFFHERDGTYSYWMYQTLIPLDILWMDRNRRIVEISADTPPCKTEASRCPHYGGSYRSRYVLEIGGGMAAKYGLKVGDVLEF
ncbi:MAG: DUF192 domain-containing protein [Acidobacteria bacterium]|nr:DUF192 domain-containing protein [Acidobacteriota bacterium]